MLERKLERCEYSGFTTDTLQKRKELVKMYAQPLLDDEKKTQLEHVFKNRDVVNDDSYSLPVAKGYEVAGLLLLLESKQYEECLSLAAACLDRQLQFSSSESKQDMDIFRIIAYATCEYARHLKSSRYYELSTRVLEHGLCVLGNAADLLPITEIIRSELSYMTPYRILDLLSRDTDESVREKGIEMLDRFVRDRGGLDGCSSLYMEDGEFKAFFRQIRHFLTLQEQLDLYQDWCNDGSDSACFLFGISLVACGFARRKPERLVQSLSVLKSLACDELDQLLRYINLLLGNIDIPRNNLGQELENESNLAFVSSDVALASLCSDCREWLERDVLDGYRDIEIDSDLEAYFSDRDVTSFIEKHDVTTEEKKISRKNLASSLESNNTLLHRIPNGMIFDWNSSESKKSVVDGRVQKRPQGLMATLYQVKWFIVLGAFLTTIGIVTSILNKKNQHQSPINSVQSSRSIDPSRLGPNIISLSQKPAINKRQLHRQLTPDEVELRRIISQWLKIKANVLSGAKIPKTLYAIATIDSIERLQSERADDLMRGETQKISAILINLKIISRQRDKIQVVALLSYSDERLNKQNLIIEKTPQKLFEKRYTLVNRDSTWKLQ